MGMDMGAMMKMMAAKNQFEKNHPKFFSFCKAAFGRGVEVDIPHHRHTDLAAHIQQAAGIVQVILLDAQHVAVVVKDDALAVDGAAPSHHVVTHGLEVVNLTVHVVGAVTIQLDGGPILTAVGVVILGHHVVAGEVVTTLTGVDPRIPDTIQQAVALNDILQQGVLLGPGEVVAHCGRLEDGKRHHTHQQGDGAQQRKQRFGNRLFHKFYPLLSRVCTIQTHNQGKYNTSFCVWLPFFVNFE